MKEQTALKKVQSVISKKKNKDNFPFSSFSSTVIKTYFTYWYMKACLKKYSEQTRYELLFWL